MTMAPVPPRSFTIRDDIEIGGDAPFVLIAGPCQIEGRDHALFMAERIAEACAPTGTRFVYKSSFDKANRSSLSTARGVGFVKTGQVAGEAVDGAGFIASHQVLVERLQGKFACA